MRRRWFVALALAPTVLAACGSTEVDAGKAESLVRENLTGPPPSAIECPEGVEAKPGATLECKLDYADGSKATVTVHVEDDDGRIRVGPGDFRPGR
jgi:hypothetical protein